MELSLSALALAFDLPVTCTKGEMTTTRAIKNRSSFELFPIFCSIACWLWHCIELIYWWQTHDKNQKCELSLEVINLIDSRW